MDNTSNENITSVAFTIDTTAPVISLMEPSDGEIFNTSSVQLSWTASDATSGIDHYNYRIDSGEWSADTTDTIWTLTNLTEGVHIIEVRALDKVSNEATASISFTIDTTAPTITDNSPTGLNVSLNSTINVTFSESMNASSVQIVVNGVTGAISWNGNTAVFTPDENLTAGTPYIVTVTGTDLAGNSLAPYSWNFTTKTESQPPVITTNTGNISGVVTDENGDPVAGAIVRVDSTNITTVTDANGHFLLENVSSGSHTLTITGEGFRNSTASVTVAEGETATTSPTLHPISSRPATSEFPWWILLLALLIVLVIAGLWMKKNGGNEPDLADEQPFEDALIAETEDAVTPEEESVPPDVENMPEETPRTKPKFSNEELIARLEKAYRDGKMSEELYRRNMEKFMK